MKFLIVVFLFVNLAFIRTTPAQQVVVPAGNQAESTEAMISWTIGEPVIETIGDGDNMLTQGLHQSKLTVATTPTAINDPVFNMIVYPNPVVNSVSLIMDNPDLSDHTYRLFDMNGKLVGTNPVMDLQTEIPFGHLRSSIYILHILKDEQVIRSFRIIKE